MRSYVELLWPLVIGGNDQVTLFAQKWQNIVTCRCYLTSCHCKRSAAFILAYHSCSLTRQLFATLLVMLLSHVDVALCWAAMHYIVAHTLRYSLISLLAVMSTHVTPHCCAVFMVVLALATGMLCSLWRMLLTFMYCAVLLCYWPALLIRFAFCHPLFTDRLI